MKCHKKDHICGQCPHPLAAAYPIDEFGNHKLEFPNSSNPQELPADCGAALPPRLGEAPLRFALPQTPTEVCALTAGGQCPHPLAAAGSIDEFGNHKLEFPNSSNPQDSLRIMRRRCRLGRGRLRFASRSPGAPTEVCALSAGGQCPHPFAAAGSIDEFGNHKLEFPNSANPQEHPADYEAALPPRAGGGSASLRAPPEPPPKFARWLPGQKVGLPGVPLRISPGVAPRYFLKAAVIWAVEE